MGRKLFTMEIDSVVKMVKFKCCICILQPSVRFIDEVEFHVTVTLPYHVCTSCSVTVIKLIFLHSFVGRCTRAV
jgi:hypothetical protein